jgi:hypothetical protein
MTRTGKSVLALAFLSGGGLAIAAEPQKSAEKPVAAAKPALAAPAAPAAPAKTTAPVAAPAKATTPATAAATPPAAGALPTAPAPELDMLFKSYEGSWKCDTTMAPGASGPNSPELKVKSMVKIAKAKDLGGFWYRGEYETKKTKATPGFRGTFMMGYDAASKTALNLSYDNTGTASLATAPNASGDTVTFVGDSYMNGVKAKTRETMIKKSPKEVEHRFEVDMGKGFQVVGTDDCKK